MDRSTTNDFMGGCSFSISDILIQPRSGWFKLLDKDEAQANCVPVLEERGVMSSDDKSEEKDEKSREKINVEIHDTTVGEVNVEVDLDISGDISDDPGSEEIADMTCKEEEKQTSLNQSNPTSDSEMNTDDVVNRAKSNLRKIGFRFSKTGATLDNLVSDYIKKQLPDTGK